MEGVATVRACANERIAEAIAARRYAIVSDFLSPADTLALRGEAQRHARDGRLVPAGVGRGAARVERHDIRGDRILWLAETSEIPAERTLRAALEALRLAINRELSLGLFDIEAHYAHYLPGACYARHRDRFRDDDARVLSGVLYLNDDWHAEEGGALRLYVDAASYRDVLPAGGTLVLFLSAEIEHEVLPATRSRWSIAGWFRRRPRAP